MKISYLFQLLLTPNLLLRKVIRRLQWKISEIKIAFTIIFGKGFIETLENNDVSLLAEAATLPGNSAAINSQRVEHHSLGNGQLSRSHRYRILSEHTFNVNRSKRLKSHRFKDLTSEIPERFRRAYRQIDWHTDFKSGYTWNKNTLYMNVKVSPRPGADIKVPRELSRFHHAVTVSEGLHESNAYEFFLQIADWIEDNPYGRGVNWACTMDVAIRAVNWIWGLRFFEKELTLIPHLAEKIYKNLLLHGHHIYNNLEYYEESTGNHYLSNIVGLIYIASRIPDYSDSDLWLAFGFQELQSEMKRQVNSDGYSHEASTNYHRLVVEMFLSASILIEKTSSTRRKRIGLVDVGKHKVRPVLSERTLSTFYSSANDNFLPAIFYEKLHLMVRVTSALIKPNGLVAQFGDNDSARLHKLSARKDVDSRDHSHILALAGEVFGDPGFREQGGSDSEEADCIAGSNRKIRCVKIDEERDQSLGFKDSGLAVMRNEDAWIGITCGTNGQNGKGGHGHNDKNSFELNVFGHDYIVDGGCPFYTSNPRLRNKYRSTGAHSTLMIEGLEQDRWEDGLKGLFTLREASKPTLKIESDSVVMGSHEGFDRVHQRRFYLHPKSLEIVDQCDSQLAKYLTFNLDPQIALKNIKESFDEVSVELRHQNGASILLCLFNVHKLGVLNGFFSRGYGIPEESQALRVMMLNDQAKTIISW